MKTSAMLSKRFCISHKPFCFALFALSIFCGISGNGLAAPNLQPMHISTDELHNAIQAGNCSATPITPGSIVSGTLSLTDCVSPFKNSAADRYTFNGTAGQKIAISLGSDSLDTYLYLIGPDGKVVAEDDDSGDGHNSRIPSTGFLRLSATGTYQIEATSYRSQVTGGYTLLLALGNTSCTYLPTATTESFTTYGGVGSLNVSTDPGCGWKTTSGVSWITISSGANGSGNGATYFTVAPNNSGSARYGFFTVAGVVVPLTQFGNPTICSPKQIKAQQTVYGTLSNGDCPSTFRSSSTGTPLSDRYFFDVIAGKKIAITVTSAAVDTHLHFVGPDNTLFGQSNNGDEEGVSRFPATGFLTIATSGRYLIEVTSAAPGQTGNYSLTLEAISDSCNFELTARAQILAANGGAGNVGVLATNGCPWQAISESSWLTTATSSTGNGIGAVRVSAEANTSESARVGRVKIGGEILFVSQLGTNPLGTVSAASFSEMQMAPESIVASFGVGLATEIKSAETRPLPTALAGTRVLVKDINNLERFAQLFFVSPGQVNFLIPAGTADGAAMITIISGDGKTATGAVQIASAAPGLFSANSNGQGAATGVLLRIKADSAQSYESLIEFDSEHHRFVTVPIDFGDETDQLYLVLFGTGFRHYSSAGDAARITAQIGGVDAQIVFAGAQGELVGVDQLNLLLPRTVAGRGEVDVKLTVNSTTANVVKVNFK